MAVSDKLLLQALNGQKTEKVPFWLMRQAGRYLPEYQKVRAQAGDFLDLVYNPQLACEVTLQPLRRFGMDAAILFADILVVPHALGQGVRFTEGSGPVLDAILDEKDMGRLSLDNAEYRFEKIFKTVSLVREKLAQENLDHAALIGFAGGPWTVACYMAGANAGKSGRDFDAVKAWAYRFPESFGKLMDILVEATIMYLSGQVKAGAQTLQIFESWAGLLDEEGFRRWVIGPTAKIVKHLKKNFPDVPVIGFPRGAGFLYEDYVRDTGVTAVSLDFQVPLSQAARLQGMAPVQGNLDPGALMSGGDMLRERAHAILSALSGGPFVFNLGHGVIKDTPPENVAALARQIREFSA